MIYKNGLKSYRDLPIRYGETSTLFRNEASGEMHGLIRVRQFTISEGHLVCTPSQLEQEFKGCLDLAIYMLKAVGLDGDVSYRFSKWDPKNTEKYINDPEKWEKAESEMQRLAVGIALRKTGLRADEIDALYAGDLINQCTASSYGLLSYRTR